MKIKNIFLITSFIVLFVSCEDAINIGPKDEITDSNAITTMEQLRLATTGVYGSIGGQSFIEWSAYFTDECRKAPTNRGSGVQVHTWSINTATDEPEAYYSGLYGTINSANTVLSKIDNVPAISEQDKKEKEKIYAELIAIRAIAHFDLLRFFATSYTDPNALAVPIVDKVIVFEKLPRNTVGQVMAFVKKDMESAYNILNELGNNEDITRITPLAVQALRARIALYSKEYDDAIAFSTEVINAVPLVETEVVNNITKLKTPQDYLDIWADINDTELVYKLKRVSGNASIGQVFQGENRDVFYNVSYDLFSKFQSSDVRRRVGALIEPGSTQSNWKVGKYSGPDTDYGLADIKVVRVAEMYLILSEAQTLKSSPDFTAAANAINTLRASRRLTTSALPDLIFTNQADAIVEILLERRRELAFEGHRYFDLKRFNLGVNRIKEDVVLNPFAEDLPAGDYRFTLPIPQNAIFANDKLSQNPRY
jgi:hypothetical protein